MNFVYGIWIEFFFVKWNNGSDSTSNPVETKHYYCNIITVLSVTNGS
jgi:hypothetical protein